MDESLPYRIAYSAGVEKCKKCRHKIASGNLQIAIMVQVLFHWSIDADVKQKMSNSLCCCFFSFSQTKTITNIRCGITVNVFSKCVCRQPKLLSMVSLNYDTRIKWSWRKIWVRICFVISMTFVHFSKFTFCFKRHRWHRVRSNGRTWKPHSHSKWRIFQTLRLHWGSSAICESNQNPDHQWTSGTTKRRTGESNMNSNRVQIFIFTLLPFVI